MRQLWQCLRINEFLISLNHEARFLSFIELKLSMICSAVIIKVGMLESPYALCSRLNWYVTSFSHGHKLYGVHPLDSYKLVLKAHNASSSLSDHEARFSPTVLSKILLRPRFVTST
ncbi:hypothetical protein Tco_0560680 [Tanacetum coccineum]